MPWHLEPDDPDRGESHPLRYECQRDEDELKEPMWAAWSEEFDFRYETRESLLDFDGDVINAPAEGPSLMLKDFITKDNIPTINFDITNDYFSDLTSESLKYHMFQYNLGYLETFVRTVGEDTDIEKQIPELDGWKVLMQYRNDKAVMIFASAGLTDNPCFVEVVQAGNKVSFNIACRDTKYLSEIHEIADKIFPTVKVSSTADTVPVSFWSQGPGGPAARIKKINPLYWKDIGINYHETTGSGIDELIQVRPPVEGGRLILWHGPPGTGKSSAIRSLIHNWLPWCNTSYVVDPEAFFGSANYMLSVLLDKKNNDYDYDPTGLDSEEFTLAGTDRWNLLIVEDADEFLQADAKQRTGQALSRLLNLADGLIGQGLNFLVLITTNEKMANIHGAVSREGRCMSQNEFHFFNRDQAKRWLGDHANAMHSDRYKDSREFSLAQLYDMRRDQQQIREDKPDHSLGGVYL